MSAPWTPQPGPQMAFCATKADITFYGGAAGAGKTDALAGDFSRLCRKPGGAGVIFRRTNPELIGGGSIWETARRIYNGTGASFRESPHLEAKWPNGSGVEFRHLQYAEDVKGHQSKQYARIGFDEATHFLSSQWWYMLSRGRSASGWQFKCKNTCNPDPTSFVRELLDWWIGEDGYPMPERSGKLRYFVRAGTGDVLWSEDKAALWAAHPQLCDPVTGPMSLTFISAKLDDNQALLRVDPGYRARLMSLDPVERARLLGGNWNIVDTSNLVYTYDDLVNGVDTVPDYDRSTWIHTVGVDFGMVDDCAWTVLASHPHKQDIYAIKSFKQVGLLPEKAADITAGLVKEFKPYTLVGDAGGLGKPYVEAWNQRLDGGMRMQAADKQEKLANIKLLNGDLRKPRLFVLRPECRPLVGEITRLRYSDESRTREHPNQANHCCDTLLYGWRHHTAFMHSEPTTKPVKAHLTPDADEYLQNEIDEANNHGREWWEQ